MRSVQNFIESFLRRKWLATLVLTALFIAIGASTIYRGAISPKQRTDLTVYLKAAEMININRANHIYGIETNRHWHYVYSPFLAILLTPFEKFPLGINVFFAYLISIGALAGTFVLSTAFSDKSRETAWQITFSSLLCLPLLLNTLSRGQLGILMLFFAALIFYTYLKNWKFVSGFLLALAITLKISPLSFLAFFFLFKKEWKILLSTLFGLLLFVFVFPSCVVGVRQNWELLKMWKDLMAAGSTDQARHHYLWSELFTPFAEDNQSFYAAITRLCWLSEEKFIVASNHGIRLLNSFLGFILLAILFLKKIPAASVQYQDRPRLLAEYSLYPMLMLFVSPVSQVHHFTILFLLFLGALLLQNRYPGKSKDSRVFSVGIWIAAGSLLLGYLMQPLAFLGVPLWGSFILWIIVLFYLKKPSTQ